MKKLFFFAAAILSAVAIHASVVTVDLTTGTQANGSSPVTLTVNAGELTVGYNFNTGAAWPNGGVEFALDYLKNVTNLSYDIIGNTAVSDWTSLHVYLKDANGIRWAVEPTASIGGAPATWTTVSVLPSAPLWTSASYNFEDAEFVAVGFLVNPAADQAGQFQLRNVKITYTEGEVTPKDVIDIDLSTAIQANTTCTFSYNSEAGELTVGYDLGAWGNGGAKFALPNVDTDKVESVQFEFMGNSNTCWTSFLVYLEDNNGTKWYNAAADLHLNGVTSWTSKKITPDNELWTSVGAKGAKYTALVFLANPGEASTGTYAIRNVKVNLKTSETTALENTQVNVNVQKVIENGQLVIIRDGIRYSVLGF